MTVELVTSARHYIGVSTDVKPSTAASTSTLQPGTRFLELDTRREFIWDGFGWVPISDSQATVMAGADVQTELLQTILCELQLMRITQEEILNWLET